MVGLTYAQQADSTHQTNLFGLGKSYGDSIVLRWAPTLPTAWAIANQHGYIIERLSYMKPDDFDPGQYQKLTPEPIKPWALEQWATIASPDKKNPMAAVAAQCIHGETITIGKEDAGFFKQANELANRWTFTLFVSDISAITATAAGLRYTDSDIDESRTYVYRIYSPIPADIYQMDTTYIVVNPAEQKAVPQPSIAKAVEMEGQVQLEWDRELHSRDFTAYYIERSSDGGKSFEKLTDLPFVSPPSQDSSLYNPHMVYIDSVQNYIPYQYRITGITPFGDISQASVAITAMGRDRTPPPAPVNLKATSLGGSRVQISWEMDSIPSDMEGFYVGRSENALTDFQPLNETPLSVNNWSFIDEEADPLRANYYVVASKDTAGNGRVSMATYGMIVDSLPPAAPLGLKGKVDTSGIVTLEWRLGPERDIIGYEVFYANAVDHVFARITPKPQQDTIYRDTIMVKTLTEKVFYRIVAVDANYNYSPFSEVLELKRPDLIPPSPPVFSNYKVGKGYIRLEWISSSSRDVAKHILFRRAPGEEWGIKATFPGKDYSPIFIDSMLQADQQYEYAIRAIDDDGLISEEAYTLFLKAVDFSLKPPVRNVQAILNLQEKQIDIQWEYPYDGQFRYAVYRAVNGGNFMSMTHVVNGELAISDRQIRPGQSYEYAIRVIYSNGKQSGYSPPVKVVVE